MKPGYYRPFGVGQNHYFEDENEAICGLKGNFILEDPVENPKRSETCIVCRLKLEKRDAANR